MGNLKVVDRYASNVGRKPLIVEVGVVITICHILLIILIVAR